MFRILLFTTAICLLSCTSNSQNNSNTKEQCDSPDAPVSCSFLNIPKGITNVIKIKATSGTPMIIKGVLSSGGKPMANMTIYAYHTDEHGLYSKAGNETGVQKWHGKHHGWAITNDKGEYEIHTIRPGKYPNANAPAHIHAAVNTPVKSYWIADFVFNDDVDVDGNYRNNRNAATGIVYVKLVNGVWVGVRNIHL